MNLFDLQNVLMSTATTTTTTTTTVIIYESKYSPMSEGNTCIAKPKLDVLPLTKIK